VRALLKQVLEASPRMLGEEHPDHSESASRT
jgi:hypothetical protein